MPLYFHEMRVPGQRLATDESGHCRMGLSKLLGFLPTAGLLWLLFRFAPTGIGVVLLHGLPERFGLLSQVLLIDNAILVHDKRHHAGRAVFGGIGHEREALGHFAVHDVALCSVGGMLPLAR